MKSQEPAMEQIELIVFPQIKQTANIDYTRILSTKRPKSSTDEQEGDDAPPEKKFKNSYWNWGAGL